MASRACKTKKSDHSKDESDQYTDTTQKSSTRNTTTTVTSIPEPTTEKSVRKHHKHKHHALSLCSAPLDPVPHSTPSSRDAKLKARPFEEFLVGIVDSDGKPTKSHASRIKQTMSHIPITHYRLFNDPFDRYFGDQLSFFDPWRDLDTFPTAFSTIPNSFRWINEPRQISRSSSSSFHTSSGNLGNSGNTLLPVVNTNPTLPALSEKYRVQLNVAGFNPDTIRTRIDGRKVIVEAKQEDRQADGDFSVREIRKTYELPEYADSANLASFVTPNNMLVIEVPVNAPRLERRPSQAIADNQSLSLFGQFRDPIFDYHGFVASPDFRPRIIDIGNGNRHIKMSLAVKNYRPEQIRVSVKNNELLVQAENIYNDSNRSERSFLTKSISLPPGTQVDRLQSSLSTDGQLEIEAPFIEPTQNRSIEVQYQ